MKKFTKLFTRLLILSAVFSIAILESSFAQVVTVGTVCQTYQTSTGQIQSTCPNSYVDPASTGAYYATPAAPLTVAPPTQKYPALCAVLTRPFGIGDSGQDVKQLQIVMGQEGVAYVGATGYFGSVTRSAVKIWQTRNGFVSPTGAVGSLTLARMRAAWCTGGSGNTGIPTNTNGGVVSTGGPADVTIVPTASSGYTVNLRWTGTNVTSCTLNGQSVPPIGQQTVSVPTQVDYTITCTGYRGNVSKTITVRPNIDGSSLPTVNVYINPSTALVNTSATLYWTSSNAASCTLNNQTVPTNGSQQIYVTNTSVSYKVTCTSPNGLSTSSTIYSNGTGGTGFPLVNIYASNQTVTTPNSTTINWNSTGTLSCTVTGGGINSTGLSGSQLVYPTVTTTYTISCTGTSGQNVSNSVTVTVIPGGTGGNVVTADSNTDAQSYRGQNGATITFSCPANFTITQIWGTGIYYDDSSICTAALHAGIITQANGGQVNVVIGGAQNSFVATTQNGVTSTAYSNGAGSYSFLNSTGVNSANLTASPLTINSGQASTLSWSSPSASYCNLTSSGSNMYNQPAIGSTTVYPTVTTIFSISCYTQGNGTALTTGSVTVQVGGTGSTGVSVTANPGTIASGQTSTISWSASLGNYCNVSGGSVNLVSQSLSGSTTVSPTASTTYTVNCYYTGNTTTPAATGSVSLPLYASGNITFTGAISPTTVNSGQAATISLTALSSTAINYCTINGGAYNNSNFPVALISGTTYSYSGNLITYPTASTTYTVTCYNTAGQSSQGFSVSVTGGTSGNVTANIALSNTAPVSGQPVTLTWTSTNATYCNVAFNGNNFLSNQTPNSSNVQYPTISGTYTVTCYNSSGQSGSGTAYVNVGGSNGNGSVTVNVTANPASVASGQVTSLTWNSTNATYCSVSANGNTIGSSQPSSGSMAVYPSISTNYVVNCYNNNGGNGAGYAYVTTNGTGGGNGSVTANIYANSTNVYSGQSVTLNWYSSGATTCTIYANGGVIQSNQSTSGSYLVNPTQSTNYSVTCTNSSNGQSNSSNVYVTVNGGGSGGNIYFNVTSNYSRIVTIQLTNSVTGSGYINWGDGQSSNFSGGYGTSLQHTYAGSGNYTLSLVVNGSYLGSQTVYVQ